MSDLERGQNLPYRFKVEQMHSFWNCSIAPIHRDLIGKYVALHKKNSKHKLYLINTRICVIAINFLREVGKSFRTNSQLFGIKNGISLPIFM